MINPVVPYNEHYMNCYLNNLYSIVCSNNNSWKINSYQNAFHFKIESDNNWSYLLFDYTESFYFEVYEAIFGSQNSTAFNVFSLPLGQEKRIDETNIFDIETGLLNNKVVFLLIDLFYLNNGNIFFENLHREHYMLIVGCDSNKSEFIVLDNGNRGYGEYKISFMEMKKLIKTGQKKAYFHGITSTPFEHRFECSLNLVNIKSNAERIEEEIKIVLEQFPILTMPSDYKQHCNLLVFIQRCFNRQLSNKHLITYVSLENRSSISNKLFDLNKLLLSDWYNLRARILKYSALGLKIEYEPLYEKMRKIFHDEMIFWRIVKNL